MGQNLLIDTDILGYTPYDTAIRRVSNGGAVTNALKMYLLSDAGDYLGNPGKGGIILSHLMKPMRAVDAQDIKTSIELALMDFQPALETFDLSIVADRNNRKWVIEFTYVVPSLKLVGNFKEVVRGRV